MASNFATPFPSSPKSPGHGLIHLRHLPPRSTSLLQLEFTYPLKLISSSKPTEKYITIFILSYGGGLVSNDKIDLNITLEENVKLCLLTQGSTKVFRLRPNDTLTSQAMTVHMAPHSSLVLLPDPLQPFAQSNYFQHQKFHIPKDKTASLIVLDWLTEGRTARGEKWELSRFISKNEIFEVGQPDEGKEMLFVDGKRILLRDSLILDGDDPHQAHKTEALKSRMDGFSCFATLIIHGPKFTQLCQHVLSTYQAEPRIGGAGAKGWDDKAKADSKQQRKREDAIWTAAQTRGCIVAKLSGRDVESVKRFLKDLLLEGQDEVSISQKIDSEQSQPDIIREFGLDSLRHLG